MKLGQDLSKVKSRINNRQRTAVRRRMEENKNRKPGNVGTGKIGGNSFRSSYVNTIPGPYSQQFIFFRA
jgi:hypothetical protein